MKEGDTQEAAVSLVPWDYQRYLRRADPAEVRFSRGFLRCRPEKWFPGFGTHWLPLVHSLGLEVKVLEVKPHLALPGGLTRSFCGTVDDEPFGVFIDELAAQVLQNSLLPGGMPIASEIVLEYLARRFLSSLALSWSGPESSVVRFDPELSGNELSLSGAVKFTTSINGSTCTAWIAIGKVLADRIDGLWRRQIRSSTRPIDRPLETHLEIAQLAVPPSMLVDYMKPGTVIDLETMISDTIMLRLGSGSGAKPWLPARMCNVEGILGFEVMPGPALLPAVPEGTTRISIEFGVMNVEGTVASEMSQVGSLWESGIRLGDKVNMTVNSEKVAEATLCTYQGRFAVSVS